MKKYAFGVDVGGTTCKIGFFNTDGTLLDKWEIETDTADNGIAILPNVAAAVEQKLEKEGVSKDDMQGIGIGVPGPVKGDVVCRCVNLGWNEVDVAKELGGITGCKVKVGNDANVAALGEMWQGGAKGCRDVVVVTLGTGVGGGVIIDGKVVSGYHGAGGEIGHIGVNPDEPEACNCGKHGCLEQYVSATGIARLAGKRLAASAEDCILRSNANPTAKDVFDAAKSGDAVALQIVDEACAILGSALANIACVADPEVIVIGGGVSRAGNILTDTVSKYFRRHAFHACRDTRFALAGLGNDAGMYGCVRMLFDE